MKFLKNLFMSKKKKQALGDARRALEDMRDALKESRLDGHPCPDYGLKRTLESFSFRYAKSALESKIKFNTNVEIALESIIAYKKSEQRRLPPFTDYLKMQIKNALKTLD